MVFHVSKGRGSVQMAVKVDDSYRTILAVHRAEKRERNGVVASERDHTGKRLAMF